MLDKEIAAKMFQQVSFLCQQEDTKYCQNANKE